MNPAFFGPYAWDFYHQIPYIVVGKDKPLQELLSTPLDDQDKLKIKEFFQKFSRVLACVVCIVNAEENKKQVAPKLDDIKTVQDAIVVFVEFHNIVNAKLNKKNRLGNDVPITPTKSWIYSMFMLFFCSFWTYDFLKLDNKKEDFTIFYEKIMPSVIYNKWPIISGRWKEYVNENPVGVALENPSREERIKWVVGLRNHLKSWCGNKEICWECDDISLIMKLNEGKSMREAGSK